jgi:hypothetical protein
VFLYPIGAPRLALTETHLELAERGEAFDQLASAGATGLLLPGVDGDVAGLYTFSEELFQRLIDALRRACEAGGTALHEVSEAQFSEQLPSLLE